MSDANNHNCFHRTYNKIAGFGNESRNDLTIFKSKFEEAKYNLIYFGGDIQDYEEKMLKSSTCKKYTKWNLVDTGRILMQKFELLNQVVNVFVVRPDHFHLKTFANYSNFVDVNDFGSPEERSPEDKSENNLATEDKNPNANEIKAWIHLTILIETVTNLFNKDFPEFQINHSLPVIICGFSKGCNVLNELCEELTYLSKINNDFSFYNVTKGTLEYFVTKVKVVIWLDGGHSGPSKAWVNDEKVVKCIKALNWNCIVYITPYQLLKMKHFEEYKKFIEIVKRLEVSLVNKCYFDKNDNNHDDWDNQLNMHFELLKKFEVVL